MKLEAGTLKHGMRYLIRNVIFKFVSQIVDFGAATKLNTGNYSKSPQAPSRASTANYKVNSLSSDLIFS